MALRQTALASIREILGIYWILVRVTVPIVIMTELLSRLGVIDAIAPAFGPVMALVGLPPALGLAWLTGMLVGIWGAVPLLFALVPVASLSVGDVTTFSALLLFAHGLPLEQKIIQKVGPGLVVTTALRILGGLLYAFVLYRIQLATGWLAGPVDPAWVPLETQTSWPGFFRALLETLVTIFLILVALTWGLELLRRTGVLARLMRLLAPALRLAGIRGEAGHLTVVGLFLGITYGAGLLIREARTGRVSPRQLFLSCVFMGFAHSVIEDTLIVVALGADLTAVLLGRVVFALMVTAAIAALLKRLDDRHFLRLAFHGGPGGRDDGG
ncbi:nucleoside recognition domain-containing protein [Salinicola halophilus]|uniref:nucleoside recognition domain-containing protein n=1 Tax=Salinicola halophilus TaxID=184065 RepID=UPI000DA1A669|nr:nucleoside recognition domain-containing protein [Salinicola halophilus]